MANLSGSTLLVVAVSAGLFLMVAVAYTLQAIERQRRERRRLATALRARIRDFEHMLEGFPEGFLGQDLRLLVCQCLLETYQQINRLERGNDYRAAADAVHRKMRQIQSGEDAPARRPLENQAQVRDVQQLLKRLFQYVERLHQSGRIDAAQAGSYGTQLRRLNTQAALDGFHLAAREAQEAGKPRLAIHYYRMAMDRIHQGNSDGHFNTLLEQLGARVAALEAQQEAAETEGAADGDPLEDQWERFEAEDELWKKKSLYDD